MTDTHLLQGMLQSGGAQPNHAPWPRSLVSEADWSAAIRALGGGELTLLAIWAGVEQQLVHMALLDNNDASICVLSIDCPKGSYPSVGQVHPAAIRPERAMKDVFGTYPIGLHDMRPWVDHGQWKAHHQTEGGTLPALNAGPRPYRFLPSEGEALHQISVGPVHAGIIEPGHFRFTASGETVVRLEERLGYVHKGIEQLMSNASIERATQLAGRASGDSTVAYAIAFARAVEAALAVEVPARAHWIRAVMAELERVANHLGDFGAICNDASFALIHAHCGVLRELVLRAADECFGHRLMRDVVVPGGVSMDLTAEGLNALRVLLATIRGRMPALVELYDNTASLQDRTVGTGVLTATLAMQFGAGGYVGRASGRTFDSRKTPGYAPYDQLKFEVPVLDAGDVNARVWVRIREIEQSLQLIDQILTGLPEGGGPVRVDLPHTGEAREGLALVEAFRGDVFVWVRLKSSGRVERCHLRDASVFQWPLLEAAIEGNIVADFPLLNKSFNCSYSGHDL